MILAPLRGVTIRAFREVFADALAEAGFTEAITPFIPAMPGYDPLKDRELENRSRVELEKRSRIELEKRSRIEVEVDNGGRFSCGDAEMPPPVDAESFPRQYEDDHLFSRRGKDSASTGGGRGKDSASTWGGRGKDSASTGGGRGKDSASTGTPTTVHLHLSPSPSPLLLTPQFIGKDPAALRDCLLNIKAAGYSTADLNCGCPFPMVRNKGRGSGLLQHPDVFERMLAAGCEAMGPGKFSIKARLGVTRNDELLNLMPIVNRYPLRFLTIHGRIAKQMYEGEVDWETVEEVMKVAKVPVVLNGDLPLVDAESFPRQYEDDHLFSRRGKDSASTWGGRGKDSASTWGGRGKDSASTWGGRGKDSASTWTPTAVHLHLSPSPLPHDRMIGRAFVRSLGERDDIGSLLSRYIAVSQQELCGERPVLGRMKELLAYWKDTPRWRRRWQVVKLARTLEELKTCICDL